MVRTQGLFVCMNTVSAKMKALMAVTFYQGNMSHYINRIGIHV